MMNMKQEVKSLRDTVFGWFLLGMLIGAILEIWHALVHAMKG
jgi:hypothetical protein